MIRKIIVYREYFKDFFKAQEEKVQEKIEYVLDLVRFEKQVPKKILQIIRKHRRDLRGANYNDFQEYSNFVFLR